MASSKPYEDSEKRSIRAQPPPQINAAPPTEVVASATPPPEQGSPEDESNRTDVATFVVEHSPAWLVSMVFHLLMVIIMGMIVYVNIPQKPIQLHAETIYAEKLGDQLLLDAPGLPDVPTTVEDVTITPESLPPVDDPYAVPDKFLDIRPDGTTAVSDLPASQIGMALTGRQEGSARRKGLLGRFGGTALTEAAVNKGLEWLARNQRRDGSWSLSGPYADGVSQISENEAAATAMALLAFQGAGHTHKEGKFRTNVARGWKWLLQQQDGNGCFFQSGGFNHRFYTQGLCSIAVCELYGMTKDPKYREPAQSAVDYCLRSQSAEGGWRYAPNADSDVSVTGWIVMGLQSARMAGLKVPKENLLRVERYLDAVAQRDGAYYPYQRGDDVRLSMTAEALLMREYLGWRRDDLRLVSGIDWITSPENLIDFDKNRDIYYWYYATQAAHHIEGDYWKRWNAVMRQALPEQQVPRGKEAGSWDPNKPTVDQWANHGGRLYVTCLSIYMLEVYYRHLPIYSSVYAYDTAPTAEEPAE